MSKTFYLLVPVVVHDSNSARMHGMGALRPQPKHTTMKLDETEKNEVELEVVTQWSHRLSQFVVATIPTCIMLHAVAPAATTQPASLMLCTNAVVVSLWLLLITIRFRRSTHLWTYANVVTITRFTMAIVAAIWWRDGLLTRSEDKLSDGSPNGCTGGALAVVALVFIAADFLDGWLARSLQQCSALGACIDVKVRTLGGARP